jgi:hypothetical protein
VKKLYALKSAEDQSRNAIEESQAKEILVEKESQRRTWQGEELATEPAASLCLGSRQRRCQFVNPLLAIEPNLCFPIGLGVVLANVVGERSDVVMPQGELQFLSPAFHYYVFMNLHIRHRRILFFQAAFVPALTPAKQG